MKILIAARFALLLYLVAPIFTYWQLSAGIQVSSIQFRRLIWILEHPLGWSVGWWLWMIAIFVWMWLLVALLWAYLPTHRIQSMVQSSLLVIAAVLAILGVIGWSQLLPVLAAQKEVSGLLILLDTGVLGIFGAALLMAGAVTAWIGFDLLRQRHFANLWVAFLIATGLLMLPSSFLLPRNQHLLAALACWLVWCGYLATRRHLPNPFIPHRGTS